MEDELRLSLLFAGTCFIIAVLAHGIWKIRKNGKPSSKPRVEPRQWADTGEEESSQSKGFDELGIGQVRVVSAGSAEGNSQDSFHTSDEQNVDDASSHDNHTAASTSKAKSFYGSDGTDDSDASVERDVNNVSDKTSPYNETGDPLADSTQKEANFSSTGSSAEDSASDTNTPKEKVADKPKLYGSVVSNPKPHLQSTSAPASEDDGFSSDAFPEPPGFLLREGEDEPASEVETAATNQPSATYSAIDSTPVSPDAGNSQPTPEHNSPEIDDFSLDSPATQSVSGNTAQTGHKETPNQASEGAEVVSASGLGEQAKRFMKGKRSKPISRKRQEPKFGDDQMRIDFDDSAGSAANAGSAESTSKDSQDNSMQSATASGSRTQNGGASEQVEQEVLVLNVKAPEDDPIAGAALLPMLLTLGFKFGDQDIFHRHVNSNGKGPVLFSLANMFKPGIFDIDSLETFNTQGVSLFMILPIEGDPHQVFNMMHNAARKLADEFGAQVLDGRRSVLTKQGLQQYMEKIREFERKRMITRQ
ncbi:Cell division protein ZipA [Alteromonas sp. 38]|uniref:cell division protein ZipA n=1 Tax=unclassified Alteromonas TaxID=2614992 RepID=UPI0012F10702|nr:MULTISPECIES: cell division protein ZipA [unclassified Alteromonas]CAD5273423.1 Cell division protein ZipA [Alteromonas sp. 154]VXB56522.1 Cell division protein ZipA [Alteromonas sp. 38]